MASGCTKQKATKDNNQASFKVPHEERWGIYELDLATTKVKMIYNTPSELSGLSLNNLGNQLAFSHKIDGTIDTNQEIALLNIDGTAYQRFTTNNYLDAYPTWSPDDKKIAYLSFRKTLDIYMMNSDGSAIKELYDSSLHDADIDWAEDKIIFTKGSCIWSMDDDGTKPTKLTNPPKAGQWGKANLPFGDYDPRLSPDGTKIIFERLENDNSPHGNYNIFAINPDGTKETRLTNTGYSQGLASWSHSGNKIIYIVSAIGTDGKYDLYMMNPDGTANNNITPKYFPQDFLVHSAVFSRDDTKIYFIGEWWK